MCHAEEDSQAGLTMVQITQDLLQLSNVLLHNIYKLLV